MNNFLSEVQSDELSQCNDFQDWIDIRKNETIDDIEKQFVSFSSSEENKFLDDWKIENFIDERWHWDD